MSLFQFASNHFFNIFCLEVLMFYQTADNCEKDKVGNKPMQ